MQNFYIETSDTKGSDAVFRRLRAGLKLPLQTFISKQRRPHYGQDCRPSETWWIIRVGPSLVRLRSAWIADACEGLQGGDALVELGLRRCSYGDVSDFASGARGFAVQV